MVKKQGTITGVLGIKGGISDLAECFFSLQGLRHHLYSES